MIVLDNLKSGIARASLTDPKLDPTFAGPILHCGPAASSACPKKSQGKAKVENAVLQVERGVLAPLRRQRFFSLAEANRSMRPLLDAFNGRHSQHLGASRRDLFERLDLPRCSRFRRIPGSLREGSRTRWLRTATFRSAAAAAVRCRSA